MVQNLLANALKFTERGSVTLRVGRAEAPQDGVRIEVEDTGVGIDASDMPHVFDHYRQAGELSMRRKGSGLGLAISKHLVELHGGTIAVTSEVHRGLTFTVVLPLDAVASASGSHLTAPVPTSAGAA